MSTLTDEILRRRTFAIISHSDAGKTTLTEKLLLFGGDPIDGRGEGAGRRRVRSDWMAVERERGISVSSAVMSFEHQGLAFNLRDTPGHQDFSPLGFQRGHLPDLDRGPPTLPSPAHGGRVKEGATRRHPQWRQRRHRGADQEALRGRRLRDVPIIAFASCRLTCVHKGVFHKHG
jgi:hypothetical protein